MKAELLIREFKKHEIGPYVEVPCSILAPVISGLSNDPSCEVINPVNEAVAMGIAAGSYLATGQIPMVLMQNSGFCNTLNCLTSLNQIYKIPAVYLISWRGEPGINDAPEHYVMGGELERILKTFDVPYRVLTQGNYQDEIGAVVDLVKKSRSPVALVLKKGLVEKSAPLFPGSCSAMTRCRAVDIIMSACGDEACFVTTNGFISREVFHNLSGKKEGNKNPPFYMLGSMGHALPVALGIGRALDDHSKAIVLDGDGGCLMHLGAMASVGEAGGSRLIHAVLDNGCYASTGGQPTVSGSIDLCAVARGCGYLNTCRVDNEDDLKSGFTSLLKSPGPAFVHILINGVEGKGRCRISDEYSCREIREHFMKRVGTGGDKLLYSTRKNDSSNSGLSLYRSMKNPGSVSA
ncbi:MAG: hypothetical protein GXP53_08945 [Deltaproteobacteria bacterium]|nr:hypothetical protein [Deltaproteobacteria bacterium]